MRSSEIALALSLLACSSPERGFEPPSGGSGGGSEPSAGGGSSPSGHGGVAGAGSGGQLVASGGDSGGTVGSGNSGGGSPGNGSSGSGTSGNGSSGSGTSGNGSSGGGAGGGATSSGKPVFVAVGYGALRVRSLDLGLTWVDETTEGTPGDNEYLIRGVGFGKGLFVAARGYPSGSVRVSKDGAEWTSHTAPSDQWMAAVAYAGGRYIAAGSTFAWTSTDGKSWSSRSVFPSAARAMALGDSTLMVALGDGEWWRSTDSGTTWTKDSSGHTVSNETKIAHCGDSFREVGDGDFEGLSACAGFRRTRGAVHAEGTWLRAASGGIERSTDGVSWSRVYAHSGVEDIEIGYVVP